MTQVSTFKLLTLILRIFAMFNKLQCRPTVNSHCFEPVLCAGRGSLVTPRMWFFWCQLPHVVFHCERWFSFFFQTFIVGCTHSRNYYFWGPAITRTFNSLCQDRLLNFRIFCCGTIYNFNSWENVNR